MNTCVVASDVSERPGSPLLHSRIELLETDDDRVEGTAVNNGLRQLGRVLRDGSQHEGGCLFVEPLCTANETFLEVSIGWLRNA